jgi:hypothetical protein
MYSILYIYHIYINIFIKNTDSLGRTFVFEIEYLSELEDICWLQSINHGATCVFLC